MKDARMNARPSHNARGNLRSSMLSALIGTGDPSWAVVRRRVSAGGLLQRVAHGVEQRLLAEWLAQDRRGAQLARGVEIAGMLEIGSAAGHGDDLHPRKLLLELADRLDPFLLGHENV